MAKLKNRKLHSLKWTFVLYIPICVIVSLIGSYLIGIATNCLQTWYEENVFDVYVEVYEEGYNITTEADGSIVYQTHYKPSYEKGELRYRIVYGVISYAQVLLIPLWVLACVGLTGVVFYRREIEKPLRLLIDASEKIAEDCLDFQISKIKDNELGDLCEAFEQMRLALYENNKKTWRMLEERKQLNAAFAHDIRTPITVLKGYTDLLQKYENTDNLSAEKKVEILGLMSSQIERLENYAQKMSAVQKLEDIEVNPHMVPIRSIADKCKEMCQMIVTDYNTTKKKNIEIDIEADIESPLKTTINIDEELVLEVFENTLSNALRYAKEKITVGFSCNENTLAIVVEDDGKGFSKEELTNAAKPFYRAKEEKEENHFGLGLYICSIICQKSGGSLQIENGVTGGGKVTAIFSIK